MTVTQQERASDLLSLTRQLTSTDRFERLSGAVWTWRRTHTGGITGYQLDVLGQLCIWAWTIEHELDIADELMWAIGALQWVVAPSQVFGVAACLESGTKTDPEESMLEDLPDLRERHPHVQARLLDSDACRRAVDLARGISSTDARERLNAARLSADVVASRSLTDDEAGCFAGLLSYAVAIESDETVRHEQVTVLAIAAHHDRLAAASRDVALAADLTVAERSSLRRAT